LNDKDRLAEAVDATWRAFQHALSDRHSYPVDRFDRFFAAVKTYAEETTEDAMIHRKVATSVHGLREFLEVERQTVPGRVLQAADRLECLLFLGYDPHFDGAEPPRL
jgi:hypothetical protein